MKKIGKQVLFLETGAENPRNGEGAFIRLKNGDILYAYTAYFGSEWADHAPAHICACISHDEGESWDKPFLLLEKDGNAENYMSVSLLRMANGDLGMIFLRKENKSKKEMVDYTDFLCMPVFVRSTDEGKSWSRPIVIGVEDGYYCGINDGVLVQRSGRILMPLSSHAKGRATTVIIAYSDDDGASWGVLDHVFETPFGENVIGLAEPGLYELRDGELWMWCRTLYGHQYESRSRDNGVSWTPVEPNFYFTSPDSPMRVKDVGEYTVSVFNPVPALCTRDDYTVRGSIRRTPLVCATSDDGGRSFDCSGGVVGGKKMIAFTNRAFLLEDDPSSTYCYPSLLAMRDGFLVAYYHSNGGDYTLNCLKIAKVYFDEFANENFR